MTSYLSNLYLKCLGGIFAIAFISYYVQYPALSSRSGIDPSENIFRQTYPSLYANIIEKGYCDADSFVELMNVLGVIISVVIASGTLHHGLLFVGVTCLYRFLVVLGSSMYTFQWDILLIEAGFLSGVCFAPWRTLRLQNDQEVGAWPIRFLLFKLMFMSGVVKIQANCPTWNNLTALEFHFATQCLPGPLAWFAHQLHPFLLRLGVAATFIIEIPATFLLLSPTLQIRKFGAVLQIMLQILIILTGSYNFFNLLTITLCLSCMIGNSIEKAKRRSTNFVRIWNFIQFTSCAIFLSWVCSEMFDVEYVKDPADVSGREMIGIKLSMSKEECNELVLQAVPLTLACTVIFVIVTGVQCIMKNKTNRLSSGFHMLVCCCCIVVTAIPFLDLSPNFLAHSSFLMRSAIFRNIQRHSRHVSSGYGLFRRMTGVGPTDPKQLGWAGQPPSIVARPEIIFDARIDNSEEWRELNFRWKPGNVNVLPLQVAPHQPRFDWRMWFAALGSVNHNHWLVSFTHKILKGCETVLDLLDEPDLASGKNKITQVRANLYHYDFTRMENEWSRLIPGVKLVQTNRIMPIQVWTRKLVGQYLPPLDVNNPSLQEARYGSFVCINYEDRCSAVDPDISPWPCHVAVSLRKWMKKQWTLMLVLLMSCMFVHRNKRSKKLKME